MQSLEIKDKASVLKFEELTGYTLNEFMDLGVHTDYDDEIFIHYGEWYLHRSAHDHIILDGKIIHPWYLHKKRDDYDYSHRSTTIWGRLKNLIQWCLKFLKVKAATTTTSD